MQEISCLLEKLKVNTYLVTYAKRYHKSAKEISWVDTYLYLTLQVLLTVGA